MYSCVTSVLWQVPSARAYNPAGAMKRTACVMALLGAVGLLALGSAVPTPWQYGVIYWVEGVPERVQDYVNVATHMVRQVFGAWDLPIPRPTGEWQSPLEVAAGREEARRELGPDFPPLGIVVPGPADGVFWALPPLRLGDREIPPLTLVVFPDREGFGTACGNYLAQGLFSPDPGRSCDSEIWEPWLQELVGDNPSPAVLVVFGEGWGAEIDAFREVLAHELSHWAFLLWCESHGLDMWGVPDLLLEGLAEYTVIQAYRLRLYMIPPAEAHPLAAMWAREHGLADVPLWLSYPVGYSLVDFLVRRHRWGRFLVLLPDYIGNWEENLARWEPEWREWLLEGLPEVEERAGERLHLSFEVASELIPAWIMLEPLLSPLEELRLESREDLDRLRAQLEGPFPEPEPGVWEELAKRERTFLAVSWWGSGGCDTPPEVAELMEELRVARETGDWERYIATFLRGIEEVIVAQASAPVEATP